MTFKYPLTIAGEKALVMNAQVSLPDPDDPSVVGERVIGVEVVIDAGAGMRAIESEMAETVYEQAIVRLLPDEARELAAELVRFADEAES
jgi:hypothetical protein